MTRNIDKVRAKSDPEVKLEAVQRLLRLAEDNFELVMKPLPAYAKVIMEEKHTSKLQELRRVLKTFSTAWEMANKIGDRSLVTTAGRGYFKVSDTIKWLRYGIEEENRGNNSGTPLYA